MKQRLLSALISCVAAAAVGAVVAVLLKSEQLIGIVIVTAAIGFFFGLAFRLRVA